MERLGIAFFYDRDGVVDDYYLYWLDALRPHLAHLVVVVNGPLQPRSEDRVRARADALVLRDNKGFDVWAYRAGLEHVGLAALGRFDEVVLCNHTFFGPIYPLAEMFDAMAGRAVDFWGITAHAGSPADPATNGEPIPFHLNSHFIAVRRPMASHPAFRAYWDGMAPIPSYESSIRLHELVFTPHFRALGFTVDAYVDPDLYGSDYNAFFELDETLLRSRSPILKRRAFFHDPAFCQARAIDLPRALSIVERTSDYPVELIWQNIVRATNARTLHANAALMTVLPDEPSTRPPFQETPPRIALCVHAHYDDLVPEILDRATALPGRFDLIVTTDTDAKKSRIEAMAAGRPEIGQAIVRVTGARGRDMGALLISCHDLMTGGAYDLVCRVHTKKAPQAEAALGALFKRRTLGATLPGPAGVAAILALFARNPRLGLVMPPMFHIGYPTFGHSWFVNRQRAEGVAAMLGLTVPLDDFSPVAAYGGMFWFRPAALRPLFAGWRWEDFEPEPAPLDGALAHALERLLVTAAMHQGYGFRTAAPASQVAHDYAALEFKHNILAGLLPSGDPASQAGLLGRNRAALWDAHVTGRPVLGPAEADRLRGDAGRDANAARLSVATAEALADGKARAARLSGDRVAALLGRDGDAVATRLREEAARVEGFLAGLPSAGQATPAPDRVLRYVVSRDDGDGRALCPLFDPHWYRRQVAGADGETSPLDHYIGVGSAARAAPHPLVDLAIVGAGEPVAACLGGRVATSHPLLDPAHLARTLPDDLPGMSLALRYLLDPPPPTPTPIRCSTPPITGHASRPSRPTPCRSPISSPPAGGSGVTRTRCSTSPTTSDSSVVLSREPTTPSATICGKAGGRGSTPTRCSTPATTLP